MNPRDIFTMGKVLEFKERRQAAACYFCGKPDTECVNGACLACPHCGDPAPQHEGPCWYDRPPEPPEYEDRCAICHSDNCNC